MKPDAYRVTARRRRRGVAMLVVLLLISVALAVAYASMRTQTMTLQTHRNATLRASAREAAMTGMVIALKTMQAPSWSGVGIPLAKPLGNGCRFEATYTTGDASLNTTDPNYAEYPYRVTVDVTGYATVADSGGREISHHMSAVVRLIPRAVATEPAGWDDITGNTLCQWSQGDFSVNFPFRIEGPVRVRSQLDLSDDDIYWSYSPRSDYFDGLRQWHPEWRPFNELVRLPYYLQEWGTDQLLNVKLGVATQDRPLTTSISWPNAALPSGYRLYPGGKLYTVPTLPSELRNTTTWKPDPLNNPLGACYRSGRVRVYENVTVQGTMFLSGAGEGELEIYGTSVQILPVDLPPLQTASGSSNMPIRLPTVFAQDDVIVYSGSQSRLKGLVVALDEFHVQGGPQTGISLDVQGKVTAQDVHIDRRNEWNQISLWWNIMYNLFTSQRNNPGGTRYFPNYLQGTLVPQPKITIQGDPTGTSYSYHWQNPNDPVYVPSAADQADGVGLRWEIVRLGN